MAAVKKWHDSIQSGNEFVIEMKFDTALPVVAPGPRFLELSNTIDASVLTEFHENPPLATRFPWELHAEKHLGIQMDLIDTRNWEAPAHKVDLAAEDVVMLDFNKYNKDRWAQSHRCEKISPGERAGPDSAGCDSYPAYASLVQRLCRGAG